MPDATGIAQKSITDVQVGTRSCKPFALQVMVYSPESGYKFQVSIERACSATNESIWKLIFDLYKKQVAGTDFDQIVHVSFTSGTQAEEAGVKSMAVNGVSPAQANAMVNNVYQAAKALEGDAAPTQAQKQAVHDALSAAVTSIDV